MERHGLVNLAVMERKVSKGNKALMATALWQTIANPSNLATPTTTIPIGLWHLVTWRVLVLTGLTKPISQIARLTSLLRAAY